MTVWITQHGNLAGYAKTGVISAPVNPVGLTSAAVSTLATGAEYVRVSADGGSFLGFVGGGLLGSSTAALSSTNAFRIAPNGPPELFAIPGGTTKIMAAST